LKNEEKSEEYFFSIFRKKTQNKHKHPQLQLYIPQ